MTANEALEHGDLFALVGASPDELRYGHEVLVALRSAGIGSYRSTRSTTASTARPPIPR